MENTKYDVFISYSRLDYVDENKNIIPDNEVSKIKDALTKAGISYWFDEDGIYSGQNFVDRIVTNIENAKIFLFLSTENANNSQWTCKEIASADEFNKHIIPVRIDDTPYNKKILFRIADLDYIEYYTNPQKGIEDMIKSIKTYLDELEFEERRKKEDEEQNQLLQEIISYSSSLHREESNLELERNKLLAKIEKIKDKNRRENLKKEIIGDNPNQKKSLSEIKKLKEYIAEIESASLKKNAAKDDENSKSKPKKWFHIVYGCIILALLVVILYLSWDIRPQYVPDNVLEFRLNNDSVRFKMIGVEGGTFMMGAQNLDATAENYDEDAWDDASPVHSVTLSDFFIGETEVTQELWRAVMGSNKSRYKGANMPMESVSWYDICGYDGTGTDPTCFLYKLNQKTGRCFRLPTEAEWEYAARGGGKSKGYKYSGGNKNNKVMWYDENSGNKTHPVKEKYPNELGLYDMSGNVWEWCMDWYGRYYDYMRETNPSGPENGPGRVHRGGSCFSTSKNCLVSSRENYDPGFSSNNIGFRLVLDH